MPPQYRHVKLHCILLFSAFTFRLHYRNVSVREFFLKHLQNNQSGLESKISTALLAVQLQNDETNVPLERIVSTFSGGQQARLLLAAALILEPDVLLLGK